MCIFLILVQLTKVQTKLLRPGGLVDCGFKGLTTRSEVPGRGVFHAVSSFSWHLMFSCAVSIRARQALCCCRSFPVSVWCGSAAGWRQHHCHLLAAPWVSGLEHVCFLMGAGFTSGSEFGTAQTWAECDSWGPRATQLRWSWGVGPFPLGAPSGFLF